MKPHKYFIILLFSMLFISCAPQKKPVPFNDMSAEPERVVGRQTLPDGTTPTERGALIVEISGEVFARESADSDFFDPAQVDEFILANGEIETKNEGRARLDLIPDGTIVRLAPNSHLVINELSTDPQQMQTRLQLMVGKVWILLNGGDIEIETSSGLATVRGSMLSVSYDFDTGDMVVTCLEGHCSLANAHGQVDLSGGQASSIPGAGSAPNEPYPMRLEDFDDWQEQVPEASAFANPLLPAGNQPPPPTGGDPGAPPEDSAAFTEPITYDFTNQCWATWHWEFKGDSGTYTVDVPPNASVSGEIPPGIYRVHDWADDGFDNGTYESIGGSHFDTTFNCPAPDNNGEPPPENDGG